MMDKIPWQVWAVAAAVGVLWWVGRNGQSIGASVGGAVVDGASGVVLGIGDGIGLPRTNQTECDRALSEGRFWDASFACPAGRFIGAGWDRIRPDFLGA